MRDIDDLRGAGGGKGGGGGGGGGSTRTPREDPNTLRSAATARVLDLLGEGMIVGLVDGLRSVYLDGVPMEAANGDANFQGVTIHTRDGAPEQSRIPGFAAAETEHDVSAEVTQDTPITRAVSNLNVDAVRVTVRVPALTRQNAENGDLKGSNVTLRVSVRPDGGEWQTASTIEIRGKTTSPYERSVRVALQGGGPWDIRMERVTADSDSANIRNETFWARYTEIIDARLTYPDSALVGLEVDARQFGSNVPERAYDVKGRIIQVPSNYDPETREYSGFWDGQFQLAWTDNPAWIYYDLATHPRYGARNATPDKWLLYQIGQYCDELVPNGYGEQEPRFTINTVITDRQDAITALNQLASAFRGMTYWGNDAVIPTADMPADPVMLVTPANVVDGEFEYSGTALRARHSVALVTWNDPEDEYRQQVEVVEDAAAIQQFGWRQVEVTAFGCTSRGQAHRLGKWILDSERNETQTVSYTAWLDHVALRPGDIIAVADPSVAAARLGGRLLEVGTERVTLDHVPEVVSGSHWYLDVVMPSGGIERREVSGFEGNVATLAAPLSAEPVRGAVWVLSSQSVEPQLFRVLSVSEQDDGRHQITALEHDPNKYARVEQGLALAERETSLLPTGPLAPPMDITVETWTYLAGGTEHQAITASWTASNDPRVERYIAEVQGPEDTSWRTVATDASHTVDVLDVEPGEWQVRVRGASAIGQVTPWSIRTTTVAGLLMPAAPTAIDISTGTFTITLRPRGLTAGALWEFWRANTALQQSEIESNAVFLGAATDLVDSELQPGTTYYYWVRGVNAYGVSDWYPVQASTDMNPEQLMEVISGEIRETDLFADLQAQLSGLRSSWVLQVGGDGRVGGIGLAYDDEQEVIDFGVLADRFYIADGGSSEEVFPFIVEGGSVYIREALIQSLTFSKLTDETGALVVEDGRLKAEYILVEWAEIQNVNVQEADIADAAISSAKIQELAVDTINIADGAVTLSAFASDNGFGRFFTSGSASSLSGTDTFSTLSFPSREGDDIVIEAHFEFNTTDTSNALDNINLRAMIELDGGEVTDYGAHRWRRFHDARAAPFTLRARVVGTGSTMTARLRIYFSTGSFTNSSYARYEVRQCVLSAFTARR